MNLKKLQNKTILLFGKSRAFSEEEFNSQIKFHKITVVKEYSDEVVLIVDGRMMTPYEQNLSDALYEQKKAEFIAIDALEKELAKYIDSDTLLMSLKLSRDKTRLKGFLQNTMISDELFLRLLKMYSFSGEDFFENDDNRDVTSSLIERFYENIERNHNVQFSPLGLMHLISQTNNEKLIEAISLLEPLHKSLDKNTNDVNYNIITAIVTNPFTPKNVLNMFIKKSNSYVRVLIAMREDCDEEMQKTLLESSDEDVLEALSYNMNLSREIVKKLLFNKEHAKNMARHIRLNDELFNIFVKNHPQALAQNETMTLQMQEKLVSFHDEDIMISLASNEHIDEKVVAELLCEQCQDVNLILYENSATPQESLEEAYNNALNHYSLSHNENTPKHILELLANSGNMKVLQGLAKNPSTPVEILYQLQLDSTLARAVKENPAFSKHIQSENIGWV